MAFDIVGARQAGYSDLEIAEYLGGKAGFKTADALKAGYEPLEIINHLVLPKGNAGRGSSNPDSVVARDSYEGNAGRGTVNPELPSEAPSNNPTPARYSTAQDSQLSSAQDDAAMADADQQVVTSARAWNGAGAGRGGINDPRRVDVQRQYESVLQDPKLLEEQQVDYAANREARNRSVSPDSVMFEPARVLDKTEATLAKAPKQANLGGLLSDIYTAAKTTPGAMAGTIAAAYEGTTPTFDGGIADQLIKSSRKQTEENAKAAGAKDTYIDVLGMNIKRSDVRNLPQNLSFSVASMGASLLSGLGVTTIGSISTLGIGAPAALAAGTVASGAAGGAMAYRLDGNSFMRDIRDSLDKESKRQRGRPLTNEEFVTISTSPEMQEAAKEFGMKIRGSGNLESMAREHGLHEAGWEAVGNVVTLGVGKYVFKAAMKGGIIRPAAAVLGNTALEVGTEAQTQIGQHNVEVDAGLSRDKKRSFLSADDQIASIKEVAGPTILTTGAMGGAAYAAGKIADATKDNSPGGIVGRELQRLVDSGEFDKDAINDFAVNSMSPRTVGQMAPGGDPLVAPGAAYQQKSAAPLATGDGSVLPQTAPTATSLRENPYTPPAPPEPDSDKPKRKSAFSQSNDFTVSTDDDGSFDVTVHRTADGDVVIATPDGIIEHNAEFAKNKTDAELLAYDYEPLGFTSAKPVAPQNSPIVQQVAPQVDQILQATTPDEVIQAAAAAVSGPTEAPAVEMTPDEELAQALRELEQLQAELNPDLSDEANELRNLLGLDNGATGGIPPVPATGMGIIGSNLAGGVGAGAVDISGRGVGSPAIAVDGMGQSGSVASVPPSSSLTPQQRAVSGPKQGSAARLRTYNTNPLISFIAEHGLYHDRTKDGSLLSEFSPDKHILVAGYPTVFRKNGKRLDELVVYAVQDGYLPEDGDEQQLYKLIQRAIGGERIAPIYTEHGAEDEMQRRIQRNDELQEPTDQVLSEAEFYGWEQDAEQAVASLTDSERQILDEMIPGLDATGNASEEDFMREMGFTEQEIKDAAAEKQRVKGQNTQGASGTQEAPAGQAQGNSGQGQGPAGSSEGLTAPTRDDVLAQQDRADNAGKLDDKAQIDAEAQHQTLTAQNAPEQRQDNTGDMFAMEKAEATIEAKNKGGKVSEGPSLFDEPAEEPKVEAKAEPEYHKLNLTKFQAQHPDPYRVKKGIMTTDITKMSDTDVLAQFSKDDLALMAQVVGIKKSGNKDEILAGIRKVQENRVKMGRMTREELEAMPVKDLRALVTDLGEDGRYSTKDRLIDTAMQWRGKSLDHSRDMVAEANHARYVIRAVLDGKQDIGEENTRRYSDEIWDRIDPEKSPELYQKVLRNQAGKRFVPPFSNVDGLIASLRQQAEESGERKPGDLADALQQMRDKGNSAQVSNASVDELMQKTRRFASGLSAIGDLTRASFAVGGSQLKGVGVDVGELSGNGVGMLAHAIIALRAPVFVDSGAFGAFKRGLKSGKFTPMDFDSILAKYDAIMSEVQAKNPAEENDYPRPMFVMPDIVGNQGESISLIEKHKGWVSTEVAGNTSIPIIPIQKGEMSLAEAYAKVVDILGSDDFVVGIPSNAEAVTQQELTEFLIEAKPKAIHILGAASDKTLRPRIEAVVASGLDIEVTADASPIRNQIIRGVEGGSTRSEVISDVLGAEKSQAEMDQEAGSEDKGDWSNTGFVTPDEMAAAISAQSPSIGVDDFRTLALKHLLYVAGDKDAQATYSGDYFQSGHAKQGIQARKDAADKLTAEFDGDLEKQGRGELVQFIENIKKYGMHPVRAELILNRYGSIGGSQARQANQMVGYLRSLWQRGAFEEAYDHINAAAKSKTGFKRYYNGDGLRQADYGRDQTIKRMRQNDPTLGIGADKAADVLKRLGYDEGDKRFKKLGNAGGSGAYEVALPDVKPQQSEEGTGASPEETQQIGEAFAQASASESDPEGQIHHLFDAPQKSEIVRLKEKVKVHTAQHGWMTLEQAKAKIEEWKAHAAKQGKGDASYSINSQKVVLSLFDRTGNWARPWEEAGYQVYTFDLQDSTEEMMKLSESNQKDGVSGGYNEDGEYDSDLVNPNDATSFSVQFFNDIFGSFDGLDVHAVLAGCPCTDFSASGARHWAAKDADGRTHTSIELVHQTLRTIEYFKPTVWAIENPVGRIESLTGLPPWRLSFDPNQLGDPYTKKTLLWGRFNADLPIAPVEPTEGSKMHSQFGGASLATKNARSETPEGFSYSFFMANNYIDHTAMSIANMYDRLDAGLIKQAVKAGITLEQIKEVVDDPYYQDLDDEAANEALRELVPDAETALDWSDIPAKYFRIKVDHDVWIQDEGKPETVQIPAKQALKSITEDIENYEKLMDCMKAAA